MITKKQEDDNLDLRKETSQQKRDFSAPATRSLCIAKEA
jgi:hypothetical protein